MAYYPEDMKYIFICIGSVKGKESSGYITNAYLKEKEVFYNMVHMVYLVNSIIRYLKEMVEQEISVPCYFEIKDMQYDTTIVKRMFSLKICYFMNGQWKGILGGFECNQGIPFKNTNDAMSLLNERLNF